MPGTVYVMSLEDVKPIRIGHHSSTNKKREAQVRGGTHEPWKVVFSVELESKAKAFAVEMVVHAMLTDDKHVISRQSIKAINAMSRHEMVVYKCKAEIAEAKIEEVIRLLYKKLKLAPTNRFHSKE